MEIISIARSYSAPGGRRIIRPADRSCWLLVKPGLAGSMAYWTRQDARDAAWRMYLNEIA